MDLAVDYLPMALEEEVENFTLGPAAELNFFDLFPDVQPEAPLGLMQLAVGGFEASLAGQPVSFGDTTSFLSMDVGFGIFPAFEDLRQVMGLQFSDDVQDGLFLPRFANEPRIWPHREL